MVSGCVFGVPERVVLDGVVFDVLGRVSESLRLGLERGKYLLDPGAWILDQFGISIWSKQQDIADSVVKFSHTSVRACHGVGKSFMAALLCCWWIAVHPVGSARVVTTAPTYFQVHSVLWNIIRSLFNLAEERFFAGLTGLRLPGYVTQSDQWNSSADGGVNSVQLGVGLKPKDGNSSGFQGLHSEFDFVVIDEAGGVLPEIFAGAEAMTTGANGRILAIGNPTDPSSDFAKHFLGGDGVWNCLSISAFESPNFTVLHAGHVLGCGFRFKDSEVNVCLVEGWAARFERDKGVPFEVLKQLPQLFKVEEMRLSWGEGSPEWLVKVLGEFPSQSVNTLFSPDVLRIGCESVVGGGRERVVLGVDLARFGPDYSVVYSNVGGRVRFVDKWGGRANEQVDGVGSAERIHDWALRLGAVEVRVDTEGLGGPIFDVLSRLCGGAYKLVSMRGGLASPDNQRWLNSRAFWHDSFREGLMLGLFDLDPDDRQLLLELEQIRYFFRAGSMQIETKDDLKKRGFKSPDFSDAAIYASVDLSGLVDEPVGRVGDTVFFDAEDFLGSYGSLFVSSPF